MNSLGERIKARRLELKWTQEELGRRAHISTGFLSDLENGKRNVSAEVLLDLARVLGLSLDYLMTGEDSKGVAQAIEIPPGLAVLAKEENLTFLKALTLLDMQRQIIAHRTKNDKGLEEVDWRKFYSSLKEFL